MIGYIGLGNMGGALARQLALVQEMLVFDASAAACGRFAADGIPVADSLEDLARRCSIIFLCLPTSQHVETVLTGAGKLATFLRAGSIVIDQTSGDPHVTRRLAGELGRQGVTLIDAPGSGGPRGAKAGTIAIMVGSDAATFAKVRPILESVSPNVFLAGEVGSGHVIKLTNNLLSAGIRMLTMEAVTLAAKNGVPPASSIEILMASGGNSAWLQKNGEKLYIRGEVANTFALGLINKDVALACELGRQSDMPLFISNQVKALCQMAMNEFDFSTPVNNLAFLIERISKADVIPKPDTLS